MPQYEYDCPKCGIFEIAQRITDAPITHHECGEPVRRRISLTAFALKGGGWYSDGYASRRGSEAKTEGATCTPSGCEKPGCAAKTAEA